MKSERLIRYIRESVIGGTELMDGPFGARPIVYADYTASGRSLAFLEDHIREIVLPLYANTHTESSGTGAQTSRFREEAREIIARSVGAGQEHAVLFCGSGATHAVAKLIGVMGLRIPSTLDDRYHFSDSIPDQDRPIVFIGPYEHHSNELPWRESIADVVVIEQDSDGHVSLAHLERELTNYTDRQLLIGSFSAASNVTGILTDVDAVSTLLHRFGALAFWDYAAAAPYTSIEMGSAGDENSSYIDAVFISPHKFIGGPETPGLLVARRELFSNRVPDIPGGGTVTYVNSREHDYHDRIEIREEGGTPAIIGSIRAGLVFQLKEAVGTNTIEQRERECVSQAIASWEKNPNIQLLGDHEADRLSIVSFVVTHGERFLHHNFVVALLNDLFGIQSRGGCSCAGPYGHRLLGIDLERSHDYQREINRGCEGIKPGWVRVSFNYFIDKTTFDYLVDAVHFVATHGHRFLRYYKFHPESGLWQHLDNPANPPSSLFDISYDSGTMQYQNHRQTTTSELHSYLDDAQRLAHAAIDDQRPPPTIPTTTENFERLRWFPYPTDIDTTISIY